MRYTPKTELDTRITRLQQQLAARQLDGALIVQNADLFYFAGTVQQSQLYVPRAGEPILMTRKSFKRATEESALKCIVPLSSPREVPRILRENGYGAPRYLGLEMDVLPANLFLAFGEILEAQCEDISPAVRRVRAVKSEYELAALKRAARIGARTLRAGPALITEGITEVELAGKFEAIARSLGHPGHVKFRLWNNDVFYGHLMAGKRAALPSYLSSPTGGQGLTPAFPHGPSEHKIRRGEPVFVDYAFVSDGYIVDQTRVFAIGGLPDKLMRAHQSMIEIQNAIARAAKPGVTGGEIYQMALEMAEERGYRDHFQGLGKDRVMFVGHGVGLELDEYPLLAKGQAMPLEEGMVIAVEPKVNFSGFGTVGVENTYVITEQGAKRITLTPDDIAIVDGKRRA